MVIVWTLDHESKNIVESNVKSINVIKCISIFEKMMIAEILQGRS